MRLQTLTEFNYVKHLQIRQRASYLTAYVAFAFLLVTLPFALPIGATAGSWILPAAWLGLMFLSLWVGLVRSRRCVEFLPSERKVKVHSVSLLFRPRTQVFEMDQFGALISYVTQGRFATNRLELRTVSGAESLLVTAFPPASGARSFWDLPSEVEAPEATRLRKEIAEATGLLDGGFLGIRLTGAQLRNS